MIFCKGKKKNLKYLYFSGTFSYLGQIYRVYCMAIIVRSSLCSAPFTK